MKKIPMTLILLIFVGGVIFFLWKGVSPFFAQLNGAKSVEGIYNGTVSEGEYVEGEVHFVVGEFLEIVNTVSIIPVGSEHYYLAFNEDMSSYIVIRADAGWDNDKSYMDLSRSVSGVTKELSLEVQHRLSKSIKELNAMGIYPSAAPYYIDCVAGRFAIMTLINCFITIAAVAVIFICFIKDWKKPMSIATIVLVLNVCFFIYILTNIT